MVDLVSPGIGTDQSNRSAAVVRATVNTDVSKDLERLLWTEMLKHTGLEESLTNTGGEGASSFARFMVEAIAEDIAEHHPLGISQRTSTDSIAMINGGKN